MRASTIIEFQYFLLYHQSTSVKVIRLNFRKKKKKKVVVNILGGPDLHLNPEFHSGLYGSLHVIFLSIAHK